MAFKFEWDEKICFGVTIEVREELERIASDNDVTLPQLLREITDDYIMNCPN